MHAEKEGYAADQKKDNYENNFQIALDKGELNRLFDSAQETMNSYVYVDVEN